MVLLGFFIYQLVCYTAMNHVCCMLGLYRGCNKSKWLNSSLKRLPLELQFLRQLILAFTDGLKGPKKYQPLSLPSELW